MQIHSNTTGMEAGLTVAADKDGRDHCVVVVKGTFSIGQGGEPTPAEKQEPLVPTDVHYGDPASSSLKYECEFAAFKPRTDIIVNGLAFAPQGKPIKAIRVALEIDSARKEIQVVGDRRWERGRLGFAPSEPVPFVTMPLIYERAFGGSDQTDANPKRHGWELRNMVGVGYHKNPDPATIEGQPLPNLEHPRQPMRGWSDTIAPIGFGATARNWQPRLTYAGTYDERWREERFPFLPHDFDEQYFLSAPADQQMPFLQGDEVVRCTNMSAEGTFECRVPRMEVPIVFRFRDRDVPATPKLDTLIVEPDQNRVMVVWRTSAVLGRKLNALREVLIGDQSKPVAVGSPGGKRRFRSLEELAVWNREHGGPFPRKPGK